MTLPKGDFVVSGKGILPGIYRSNGNNVTSIFTTNYNGERLEKEVTRQDLLIEKWDNNKDELSKKKPRPRSLIQRILGNRTSNEERKLLLPTLYEEKEITPPIHLTTGNQQRTKELIEETKLHHLKDTLRERHPITLQPEIERQIEEYKEQGLIRPSFSPYQANVWLVKKKLDSSGKQKWRLVMDFRKLNEQTIQDNYPLPSIQEILCLLGKAKFMSCFDMANGFYRVLMEEKDIEKTAFSTHKGHWEWLKMPMELINSPATYQRMANFKHKGLIGTICFIYLDDLIVIGTTEEEHLGNLETVFKRLR